MKSHNTPKNEMIGVPCADAPNKPAEVPPTPAERNANARAARDRLREATLEAFPRSTQYRPTQDRTRNAGSGEA